MKKRKILFLLAAVLSVTLLLVGCGEGDGEFSEYFKPSPYRDTPSYTELVKLEGDVVDYSYDNDLVATRETDVDILGEATETFKVIDLKTGEVLFQKTFSWDNFGDERKISRYEREISIDYFPLIQIEKSHIYWSGSAPDYTKNETVDYDYYLPTGVVTEDDYGSYVTQYSKDSAPDVYCGVNLYTFKIGGHVFLYDGDFEKIVPDTVSGTALDINDIDLDMYMNGRFYSSDNGTVTIFDKSFIPVAHFEQSSYNDEASCIISYLNNGNVLVQEIIPTDNADYDIMITSNSDTPMAYYLNNHLINAKSGEISEIKLDYIAESIVPAFAYDDYEYLFNGFYAPTSKTENVAAIVKIVDRAVDVDNSMQMVALDNNGKIVAESPLMRANDSMYFLTKDRALKYTPSGIYLCDASFNTIAYVCDNDTDYDLVNDHILIENKLYDLNMKLVYDFTEYADDAYCEVYGDTLFVYAQNPVLSDCKTVLVYDFDKGEPVVIANGFSSQLYKLDAFPYCVYGVVTQDAYDGASVLKAYNANGDLLFECLSIDGAYAFDVVFDGYNGVALVQINGSYYVLR